MARSTRRRASLRGTSTLSRLFLLLAAGTCVHVACIPDLDPLSAGDDAPGGNAGQAGAPMGGVPASAGKASNAGTAGAPTGGLGAGGAAGDGGESTGGNPASGAAGDTLGGSGGQTDGGAGQGGEAGFGPDSPIAERVDVSLVWSGHYVSFSLHTVGENQFVAYYDQDRRMTIAMRKLGETTWQKYTFNSMASWDSHESIRLALDEEQHIHIAGNMHNDPLEYYRTKRPLDVQSFERVYTMVDSATEQSCTYPEFLHNAQGQLLFTYREGGSGDGNTYVNRYNVKNKTWERLVSTPLLDGEGKRNAYIVGPTLGPDGYWHLVWVWRDTPDAATNHHISYARTRDMVTWENGAGEELTLPIRLTAETVVDPIPTYGGLVNNNTKVGFDNKNRPVVVYHKYDPKGATQLYNARYEGDRWKIYKTTNWTYRWEIGGSGTLVFPIEVEGVRALRSGILTQRYYHAHETNWQGKVGWGAFRLNPDSLIAEELIDPPLPYPRELDPPEIDFKAREGDTVKSRWAMDAGSGPDPDIYYMARWETLDSNFDQPRDPPYPPPSMLRIYAFRYSKMPDGI